MLSIIICSNKPHLKEVIDENIRKTIGSVYELIWIDNTNSQYSLAKAYNTGASVAKFDFLVFLHDDVRFVTNNWGNVIVELLKDNRIGLVGISGSTVLSKYPSTWSMVPISYYRVCAVQHWRNGSSTHFQVKDNDTAIISNVVVVDGVFLATTKMIWKNFYFDDALFDGFHFYDLDFSLRVSLNYSVVVCHSILLEHFSEGNLNKNWISYSCKFVRKHKKILPRALSNLSFKQWRQINYSCVANFAFVLVRNGFWLKFWKYFFIALCLDLFNITNKNLLSFYFKNLLKCQTKF